MVGKKNALLDEAGKEAASVSADLRVRQAEAETKRFKKLYQHALDELDAKDQQLEAWLQISKFQKPLTVRARRSSGDEAVAVAPTSDWHIEERIDPSSINGLNEYNPDIAKSRVNRYFQNLLTLVRKERSAAAIDTLVLGVLGDIIAGHIHEELAETNWLHPVEAVRLGKRLLIGGIEFLLEHGKFKEILIPCCYGNHGRVTKKMRVSNAAKTSYEWMMYHDIAEHFAKEKRLKFQVADGYLLYMDILGTRTRLHHGNGIRYQGGVGGMTIPLYKAIAQWNKERGGAADLDICGHWHSLQYPKRAVVNGSIVGYNAYSQFIKAEFEPPQQAMFLIGRGHGPCCFNRVFCEA